MTDFDKIEREETVFTEKCMLCETRIEVPAPEQYAVICAPCRQKAYETSDRLLAATEQEDSLADKLKRLGYEKITDAKCIICGKPINSQVDGLFCSVACEIAATEQESE